MAARPARAGNRVRALLEVAARGGGAKARRRREAFEVAAEDDVGDACHRIRAILGRGAIRHDLEPFDRRNRNRRDVDPGKGAAIGQAVAVEQGERRIGAEAAEVELRRGIEIAVGKTSSGSDPRILATAEILGNAAHHFAEIVLPRLIDAVAADGNDWRGDCGAAYVRTGHDDDLVPGILRRILPRLIGTVTGLGRLDGGVRRYGGQGGTAKERQRGMASRNRHKVSPSVWAALSAHDLRGGKMRAARSP